MATDPRSAPAGGDIWSAVGTGARRDLLLAALDAFAERGFHATTTREIGGRVGLSPAAVYVHYPSKAELLYRISSIGHAAVLAEVETALSKESAAPARLRAFAAAMATWHAEHHQLARVIQYELRSLPAAQLAELEAVRRRFSTKMRAVIKQGVEEGAFDVPDVRGTAAAILSLCIDVARWYTAATRRQPKAIGQLYGELAVRMARPGRPD